MPGIARTTLSLLAVITLTTAIADGATSSRYAASVQDLQTRTRAELQVVGNDDAAAGESFPQTHEIPKTTFHVGQIPRSSPRIIEDLTKAFAAYITVHAIECQAKSAIAPPEAVASNPIADALWRRLQEMTGGRVSANVGFQTQERIAKNRLVPQRTLDAKVTVGLFGPQFSHARVADRCL